MAWRGYCARRSLNLSRYFQKSSPVIWQNWLISLLIFAVLCMGKNFLRQWQIPPIWRWSLWPGYTTTLHHPWAKKINRNLIASSHNCWIFIIAHTSSTRWWACMCLQIPSPRTWKASWCIAALVRSCSCWSLVAWWMWRTWRVTSVHEDRWSYMFSHWRLVRIHNN